MVSPDKVMVNESVELPESIEQYLRPESAIEGDSKYMALGIADAHDRQHGTGYAAELVKRMVFREGKSFDANGHDRTYHDIQSDTFKSAMHKARVARAVGELTGTEVRLFEVLDNRDGHRAVAELTGLNESVIYDEASIAKDWTLTKIAKHGFDPENPIIVDRFHKWYSSGINWVRAMHAMKDPAPREMDFEMQPDPEPDYD